MSPSGPAKRSASAPTRRCGTPGRRCSSAGRRLPEPAALGRAVDGYNAAIGRVADRERAILVDLHAAEARARADGTEPSLVAADGFHPSTAGHGAVAATFAAALANPPAGR